MGALNNACANCFSLSYSPQRPPVCRSASNSWGSTRAFFTLRAIDCARVNIGLSVRWKRPQQYHEFAGHPISCSDASLPRIFPAHGKSSAKTCPRTAQDTTIFRQIRGLRCKSSRCDIQVRPTRTSGRLTEQVRTRDFPDRPSRYSPNPGKTTSLGYSHFGVVIADSLLPLLNVNLLLRKRSPRN
jgi:hypothetical protein